MNALSTRVSVRRGYRTCRMTYIGAIRDHPGGSRICAGLFPKWQRDRSNSVMERDALPANRSSKLVACFTCLRTTQSFSVNPAKFGNASYYWKVIEAAITSDRRCSITHTPDGGSPFHVTPCPTPQNP